MLRSLKSGWQQRLVRRETRRLAAQLAQSRQYCFTQDWMSGQVKYWRQYLAKFAGRPDIRMLEIGSFEGRSTIWFLENIVTHPTSRLVCVDPFFDPLQEVRFDHNVSVSGAASRVDKRRGRSEEVVPELERGSYDLIYVDGCHDAPNVMLDAMLGWELLKQRGIMIFDDYKWEAHLPAGHRPRLAIDLFLGSHSGRYDIVHQDYQVAISKKPA